jgi:hypothetical protein
MAMGSSSAFWLASRRPIELSLNEHEISDPSLGARDQQGKNPTQNEAMIRFSIPEGKK